jgi:hypothetical protein
MPPLVRGLPTRLLPVLVAALSVLTAGAVGWKIEGRRLPPPADADALVRRVAPLGLHVTKFTNSMYLSVDEKPRDELNSLLRSPTAAARWRGVVIAQKAATRSVGDDEEVWYGRWLLYGDPALVRRVCETLEQARP